MGPLGLDRADWEVGRRRKGVAGLLAAMLVAAALLLAAPASAQGQTIFLGPDLGPEPDFTVPCGAPCTIFGLEGPYNPPAQQPTPIVAPDDGTVSRVDLRVQQGQDHPIPIELTQMELVGDQVLFKSFHPLGSTTTNGINTFAGLGIPVDAGTVLGVSVEPAMGGSVDGYATPGENGIGVVEPTPAQGEQRSPAGGAENQPAIRLAFVPDGPDSGRRADIEVIKTRTTKRRPGVGGSAGFDVTVKNNGPDAASGVTLYDSYEDPDLMLRSARRAGGGGGGGNCVPSPFGVPPAIPTLPGAWGGNVVVVCNVGNLAVGASVVYHFDFEVGPLPFDVRSKVVFNDAAADATAPPDPNYTNNYSGAQIKVCRGGCRVRDVIQGTEDKDKLVGGKQPEAIYGLGGKDKLKGKKGDDCLFGNEAKDKLVGGPGRDRIDGGEGSDRIKAADGERDKVDCGGGKRDRAKVDKKDRVRNCEKVKVV